MRSALGCAALGVLLLVVAGTFDAEPLYVTGAALLLLGAGALAWIGIGGYGAKLAREIDHRSVIEEQPLHVKLHVQSGRLPLPPGWIDEPLLPSPLRLPAGRRQARVRIEVTFGRRGRRRLPPPALVLRDPFGLAQKVVAGPATDEILVLPRIFAVNLTAGGGDATPAHARASLLAAAETEIDGLRPWREGSPASRIHWQTFARSGVLMERKLISEADSRPLVVIDPRAPILAGRARRRRARRRLAGRPLRAQDRLLAADAGRPARVGHRARPARVARAARPARAARRPHRPVAGRGAEPPRAGDLRRRPPGRPRAARARPHARRLPRGRARERWATVAPMLEVAGCHGYVSGRQSGAAAVAALEGAA